MKINNCYFKSIFICGGYENDEKVKAIHPPIDSQLLDALYENNIGKNRKIWREAKWSKFNNEQYEKVIQCIRDVVQPDGLWTIEQYWKGYQ